MRVHKLTFAALAVAAGLTLTACQNGEDGAAQGGPSSASSAASTPPSSSTPSSPGGGSSPGGSDQGGGKGSAGTGSNGKGTAAGTGSTGSTENAKADKCRTDDLEITAIDSTIGGDTDGTVAVQLKNRGSRDCTLSEYAGVDLKTSAGSLSAQRTGEHPGPAVLKKGAAISFGVTYPLNTSGGSGVRVTGLVVTPPDETKSVTLAWPGAATLPVTDGTGSPVKVGPIGSAGQGG
ncbi:DUF4232 domain-containing protein [Streptomyces sp. NBC_00249]|uniref:DUF4232 domain-containing protein n=1 Tax=Streptomyces sp. NBC_00249 TaxID=2975690 RepID=UPI00224F0786|nr:DUF4232 domain-containing protein [Streptomyces sp. NBC_00249]MCX5199369.1 DUF4232 domain-containing protein [Streptomyces sp. NBC_00249]